MPDKILYTGGPNPFKGLIGLSSNVIREHKGFIILATSENDFQAKRRKIDEGDTRGFFEVSNAPDIVNWTELPITGIKTANKSGLFLNDKLLVIGDIFDLPVGYEFKKEGDILVVATVMLVLSVSLLIEDIKTR